MAGVQAGKRQKSRGAVASGGGCARKARSRGGSVDGRFDAIRKSGCKRFRRPILILSKLLQWLHAVLLDPVKAVAMAACAPSRSCQSGCNGCMRSFQILSKRLQGLHALLPDPVKAVARTACAPSRSCQSGNPRGFSLPAPSGSSSRTKAKPPSPAVQKRSRPPSRAPES